ncbi:Serine/threonine protein kinase [Handroanthus impetiginosus]|uniref:Serine/threonine protein kinase n=1 Tax=Handroanthus impetiginosus TaxID=429701 RepID=A0A2G9I4J4_9LAMI|nr:Serine/threonine protein kinase [Handroanthus impetiginosus]
MGGFQPLKILSCLSIWFLFHLSTSNSYTLPDKYFINCGSPSSLLVSNRTFTSDEESHGSYGLSSGDSKAVEERNLSDIELYRTARIFNQSSSYEFNISQNGTYVVRFHFFPFSSLGNLSDAHFNILASGSAILSNFTVKNSNTSDFLPIQEFFLPVRVGKLRIDFVPFDEHSFAFANAIEVFLAPPNFIPDSSVPHVSGEGKTGEYNGLLRSPLHVIHRINVGGNKITPDNDTLLRYWIPDDGYLLHKNTARNTSYEGKLNYQRGGATHFNAPDSVYRTAQEMNIVDKNGPNTFNISWRFEVRKQATHLVRLHFCDFITLASNETSKFNLYIYSDFSYVIRPYDVYSQAASPFYKDFVLDSDDSGLLSISVGPETDNDNQTAFLNGVEIMEVIDMFAPRGSNSKRMKLFIIIGPCVGGVVLVLIILAMVMFCLRRRKWMPVETTDWHLVPLYGGSSHSRTTVKSSTGSMHADLNLGLKISFSEILFATRKFYTKLMIGEGGFGKVYKGTLKNGAKVAVKRSEPGHGQGLPEFRREIMVLSKIRHQNLVPLIGYCDERDEMILVYEFMEKGTLRDHLYSLKGESKELSIGSKLSWDQRLRICINAARGLDYLHTGSSRVIIHRDIKSTNILLDEHYVAKVADFGLSRLDQVDQTHVTTDVKGSFGYLDPEYFRCFQLTLKSDVYSFGVVLLEVLCARPVIDHSLPREQGSLSEWAMSWQRKGELDKIVDPLLVGKININCLRKYGEIVEKCLQEYGVDRPSMVDVLWDLEYCLKLQNTAVVREPYEDSTTDVGLPLPIVQRLPSASLEIGESEVIHESYSYSDGDAVFSQLKLDGAR